ncbi:MAG TPA: hypothetical protein VGD59_13020, partial [Acidisarcina sp.]
MPQPLVNLSFPHHWSAEVLPARPLILPARHFVYPEQVEEVERGALEVLVRPEAVDARPDLSKTASGTRPFLATCALGFDDPSVPTGVWSCPDPDWLCAVAGGYAYLINARDPTHWQQVEYRPVLVVLPLP